MAHIFISYRREDTYFLVSQLVNELREHFPTEQVFQDIRSIDPGADFVEALDKALSTAAVMLAVIGRHWLSATDKQGRRRLDMPGDFVRQEIAESLRRPGVRVFPLLVNDAEMPAEEELPEPLKALHRRQAFELTVRHWHHDVAQLIQTLKRAPGLSDDRRADEDFTPPGAEQALLAVVAFLITAGLIISPGRLFFPPDSPGASRKEDARDHCISSCINKHIVSDDYHRCDEGCRDSECKSSCRLSIQDRCAKVDCP